MLPSPRDRASLLLLAALGAPMCAQVTRPDPATGLVLSEETVVSLIHNSSGDVAHRYVSQIALARRVEGTPEYQRAVAWLADESRALGLAGVRVERYPADGTREYLGYRTKRAWSVDRAELWMESPQRVRLTSYDDLAISLCRNSVSAEVGAELVDVGAGLAASDYKVPVAGRIVLTSSDPVQVAPIAVRERGAAGIVSFWTIPEWDRLNRLPGDYPDLVGWRYLAQPASDETGTFAFMISPRRAAELKTWLAAGPVRLRASVDARLGPGTLDVITATIPGTGAAEEEITLTAHLDEIGADDNASGSAALLEVARTLQHLIRSGQMRPPRRTIRFLWGPEFSASAAWMSAHLSDPVTRVAALNMDQLGARLAEQGSVFLVSRTPDAVPSFINALLESGLAFMQRHNDVTYPVNPRFHIISVTGSRDRLHGRMAEYTAGSDHEIFNKLGIPAAFLTVWPEKVYHSSADTPDKVDATQLHRAVFLALSALVPLAWTEGEQALSIAELAAAHAHRRAGEAAGLAAERVLSGDAADLLRRAESARVLITHAFRTGAATIRSAAALGRGPDTGAAIEALARNFAEGEGELQARIASLVRLRAARMKITARTVEAAPAEAASLFPTRRSGHLLSGAGEAFRTAPDPEVEQAMSAAERFAAGQGASSLRLMGFADVPAFYANGQRSVLDIRDAFEAEYGAAIDAAVMLRYFRAFEKAGIIDLVRK